MSRYPLPSLGFLAFGIALTSALPWGSRTVLQAAKPPGLFVSVVDRNGTPVTGLKPSQVTLQLDRKPCTSVRIEPIDWPMKLQVLVDNGVAIASSLPTLKDALREFFDELPEGVETSLVTYSPQPQVVVPPTTDPQKRVQGLDRLASATSDARFIEAVSEATTRIARTKGDFFHTVMVVTTNGPEGSRGNVAEIVSQIRKDLSKRPVTAHVLMLALGEQQVVGKVAGAAAQMQVGVMLTTATRGTYESVNA